jgi:hypothetical protein
LAIFETGKGIGLFDIRTKISAQNSRLAQQAEKSHRPGQRFHTKKRRAEFRAEYRAETENEAEAEHQASSARARRPLYFHHGVEVFAEVYPRSSGLNSKPSQKPAIQAKQKPGEAANFTRLSRTRIEGRAGILC